MTGTVFVVVAGNDLSTTRARKSFEARSDAKDYADEITSAYDIIRIDQVEVIEN